MYNNECISYKVDADLLAAGIPIEQLEKKNVKGVPLEDINMSPWRSRKPQSIQPTNKRKSQAGRNTRKMAGMMKEEQGQAIREKQELYFDNEQYQQILLGRLCIRVDNPEEYIGKTFRIVDKKTKYHCYRTFYWLSKEPGVLTII